MARLPAFTYVEPTSLDEVLAALAGTDGGTVLLAGGAGLITALKVGRIRPERVINLKTLPNLAAITAGGDTLRIGALARIQAVADSPLVRRWCPVLAAAAASVGSPQIRQQATLGGNLCSVDPPPDLLPALAVLDATVDVAGPAGLRKVPITDLAAAGPGPEAVILGVKIPFAAPCGWGFHRISGRVAFDGAIASAAALLTAAGGRVTAARVAVGALGPRVQRCLQAEALLVGAGTPATDPAWTARLAEVAAAVMAEVRAEGDLRASADYRRHLAGVLAVRAVADTFVPDGQKGSR